MRRPLLILLIVVAVLLLVVISVPFLVNANQFRPLVESQLSKTLGRNVRIGDLKLGLFSGTVTASDLSIADDPSFNNSAFLQTKGLSFTIDVWSALFSHKFNVSGITIDKPQLVLTQATSGQWNFSSMGTKPSAARQTSGSSNGNLAVSVKTLKITNARVSLTQSDGKPQILDPVNIEVTDFTPASAFPFSISAKIATGGDLALQGKAGPIDSADAANTSVTANVKLTNLNLAASGAVPPASGIDGIISMDGSANSNGQVLTFKGTISAAQMKLAPGATAARNPLLFDTALTANMKQHSGQLSQGNLVMGGVKASLTGTWVQQNTATLLQMSLSAPGVPVSSIIDLLPALNLTLPSGATLEGGTAAAFLTISGPVSALVTTGPIGVQNTRVKGFDLSSKMSSIEKLAGPKTGPSTEIQKLTANVRIAPDGITAQNIDLVVPAMGELTGNGTISPNRALNFSMLAAVHSGTLVAVGASSIPFSITGTTSDPQFHADTTQIAAQQLSQKLKGVKVGGVDAGKTTDTVLQGLFGGKKK